MQAISKIAVLSTVLVLCCAGLAGSAYAYTATGYTDYALPSKTLGTATIGEFAVSYKATAAQV